MPEIYRKDESALSADNPSVVSKYCGDEEDFKAHKAYAKLGRKITDNVKTKLKGVKSTSPEYWGLREVLTEDEVTVGNMMKLRKWYKFEDIYKKARSQFDPKRLRQILDLMSVHGIVEYDYGDHYDDDGPTVKEWTDEWKAKEKRYRISFFVPGSAELFNSSVSRIKANPPVASFFERMTFLPLEDITPMVMPGGMGIGMHVIPVEKAIESTNEAVKLEKISYWLRKYDGHISAGICSCRQSRAMLGEGCADDSADWCIQLGDMADYTVETGRAHYITKEKALEILQKAEENGYVHQLTNIDGETHIFDICNCNPKICNALRTALLFNTPNMERSAYVAKVKKENCVACGRCVEVCPAGAVKLGQKLCSKKGEISYPRQPLPDKIRWGKYAWDENYRDTTRINTYPTGTSPCKTACPAHIAVQGYLKMAREGRYAEALKLIKRENPFPAVCGRVCNKRCEDACTRGIIDKPVSIDAVKKFLANRDLDEKTRIVPEKAIAKVEGDFDQKIAIIGGGPAGLSCAYFLALKGYHPVVFEKRAKAGGMMTYGIPTYKLEKDVIEAEIVVIEQLGAEIRCGVEVGKDVTIAQLRDQGFKAFYVAIGCQGGRLPGVENEKAPGTSIAVDFLREAQENQAKGLSGNVVVVGGGNVAIDCACVAMRLGAASVSMHCLETRDIMPASKQEIADALEMGVTICDGWGPKSIRTDESGKVASMTFKKCVSVFDENGKFNPKYDESATTEVKADHVVFAIGQSIEWNGLLDGTKVKYWHGNYPMADKRTYQTDEDDIFVGGDVYSGPKFVIDAIAAGHEAAESIIRRVSWNASMTIGRDPRHFTELDKDDAIIEGYDTAGRQEAGMVEGADWKSSFRDFHGTLSQDQVQTETSRCLSCGASHVDPNRCIGCGLCTTRCDFDAIHLHRERPECTNMRRAEDKVTGLLGYAIKRGFRILLNSGSAEARQMRAKRKAFNRDRKKWKNERPHTGNSVPNAHES